MSQIVPRVWPGNSTSSTPKVTHLGRRPPPHRERRKAWATFPVGAPVRQTARHAGPRIASRGIRDDGLQIRRLHQRSSFEVILFNGAFVFAFVLARGQGYSPRLRGRLASVTSRRNVGRRPAAACASGDRPYGRSWPPARPAPSSCRACVPDAAATSSPPAWPAASGTPPR